MMKTDHTTCRGPGCSFAQTLVNVFRRQEGSSAIELALVLPIFVLLLAGAVDFGRGFYAAIEVSSAAQAGVCYGVQQPGDIAGIQAAAKLGAPDVNGLAAAVTTGCECSDGTSATPGCALSPVNCTANIVNYVQVITTATYNSTLKYTGIPATFTLQGKARMRAVH